MYVPNNDIIYMVKVNSELRIFSGKQCNGSINFQVVSDGSHYPVIDINFHLILFYDC